MAKKELVARLTALGVLLSREVSTAGSEEELKLRVAELEEELEDDTPDPEDDAAASGETGEQPTTGDAGGEPSSTDTGAGTEQTITDGLVTVETRVTLHIDALHATKNERISIVALGTSVRVTPTDAAELIAQGLAAGY
jgi:hypothetical protein